jgi:hypothetical protein
MGNSGMRMAGLGALAAEKLGAENKLVSERTANLVTIAEQLQQKLDDARAQKSQAAKKQGSLYLELVDKYRTEAESMQIARDNLQLQKDQEARLKAESDAKLAEAGRAAAVDAGKNGGLKTAADVVNWVRQWGEDNAIKAKVGMGVDPTYILRTALSLYPKLVKDSDFTQNAAVMQILFPTGWEAKMRQGWSVPTISPSGSTKATSLLGNNPYGMPNPGWVSGAPAPAPQTSNFEQGFSRAAANTPGLNLQGGYRQDPSAWGAAQRIFLPGLSSLDYLAGEVNNAIFEPGYTTGNAPISVWDDLKTLWGLL